MEGKNITWQQFRDAFDWDQSNFSLTLHKKLTLAHFDIDSAAKMRNHLAEDVLDRKMLFLMKVFFYGETAFSLKIENCVSKGTHVHFFSTI